jgi:NAD(P)-dependent dehydrogenase (short-subunit alcohol dehydrogenase family)
MGQDVQYKRQRLLKHYTRLYTLSQVWGLFLKPHIRVWNLPWSNFAVSRATNAAVIGFSMNMALELGPRGVRTNAIAPGAVRSPTNMQVIAG